MADATGLTPKEKQLIAETWAVIDNKEARKANAVEFLVQLFTAHSNIKDFFSFFKGQSIADVKANPKLKFHATIVFHQLTAYVENLDDPDTLVGLIQKFAYRHIERGISTKEFQDLKVVFLNFAKSVLGGKYTADVAGAWDKFLNTHNSVYQATVDEVKGKK